MIYSAVLRVIRFNKIILQIDLVGYNGTNCENSIYDSCACKNGGVSGVKCICPPSFVGPTCELRDGSVCANVTCSGHGTCSLDNNAGYKCLCDGKNSVKCILFQQPQKQ